MDLIQQIPPFATPLAEEGLSILDAQVEYVLEWKTTAHTDCSQPIKRTRHYYTLGITEPIKYGFLQVPEAGSHTWLCIEADQAKYLIHLIFAWTFIVSSRWVEILQVAGEEVYLRVEEDINSKNFWKIVTEQRWQANIISEQITLYAPWSLRQVDEPPPQVS